VPVAAVLKDSIVGITCFPDPLPRRGKRGSRRWWRRTKRPATWASRVAAPRPLVRHW